MNEHDATELAYNRGYEAGKKETAKKIVETMKKFLEKSDYDYYYFEIVGICKEFEVELNDSTGII